MTSRIEDIRDILTAWHQGEFMQDEAAHQICQLFPQPLDDKELREKMASIHCFRGSLSQWNELFPIDREPYYKEADQILALLQPKIEEAQKRIEFLLGQLKFADRNYLEIKNAFDERLEEARRQGYKEGIERAKKEMGIEQALKGGE